MENAVNEENRNWFQRIRDKFGERNTEPVLTHKQVVAMIPAYLRDELDEDELIPFLDHVENCHECYEELETMFMVDRTIRYLDKNEDDTFDLKPELLKDMRHKLREVSRKRFWRKFQDIVAWIAVVLFAAAVLDFFGILPITRYLFF